MNEYRGRRSYGLSREVEELLSIEEEERRSEQQYLARKRRREKERRRMARLRKRRRALLVRMAGVMFLFIVLIVLVNRLFFSDPVLKELTVEAGADDLTAEKFLRKDNVEIEFVTDMSEIDLGHVGEYEITLQAKGKERTSTLIVQDTVSPVAVAVSEPVTVATDSKADAALVIESVDDATDVEYTFKEKPDLSSEGNVPVTVVVTDEGGNTTEVEGAFNVIVDTEAPVINGVAPLTGFLGDPISYKSEITVTDNCDKDIEVEVDNSNVDTEKAGTYNVIYTASDQSGNTAQEETTITIKEKPENYVEPEEVYALADEVLAEITTDDMTLKEKARAIYDWTRNNVGYINTSEKDSWTNGAYQGFTEGQGDCFVFFATAKALLTRAEIPNIDIVKSDTSHSSHYWSLVDVGDGWYHFDTTPRYGGGEFFLMTDDEILAYSEAHDNSHIFDRSLYPATPTTDSTIE